MTINIKEHALKALVLSGVAVSGLILAYSVKHYLKRRKYNHIKGPKTRGVLGFFIGNLIELNEADKNGFTFPDQFSKWREEYGDIYKMQFFYKMVVVICDPIAIREAVIEENLAKNEFIYKFMMRAFGVRALGDGLVTLMDHEKWRHKRALFNHGFQRIYMDQWVKEFNDKSDILMEKFRSLADGKTLVTFHKEINRFALDAISSIAFDINTGAINNPNVKLNVLLTEAGSGFNELFADPLLELKPYKRSMVKKYANVLNELRDFAREHIMRRIKEIENKEYVPNDILSIMISNANGEIDLEELVDDFVTFFAAGQETTSNSLSFTVLELGLNPHCFQRARAEIDEILGSKNDVTYEDLTKLEYVSCVFKESLRKWPTVCGFSRVSRTDMVLNGVFIPKDTWIEIPIFAMNRNPTFYPDPEKFEPERFLKGSKIAEQNTINSYTYFPFSLGPRNCIGQNFAQLEAKMFLVKFIKNFDFELDPTQSFSPIELTTLRPKDGCRMYLKLRQNK